MSRSCPCRCRIGAGGRCRRSRRRCPARRWISKRLETAEIGKSSNMNFADFGKNRLKRLNGYFPWQHRRSNAGCGARTVAVHDVGACARPSAPLSLCPSELGSADCWQLSTTNGDWFQPHSDQYKTMLKVVVGKLLSILHFLLPRKISVEPFFLLKQEFDRQSQSVSIESAEPAEGC